MTSEEENLPSRRAVAHIESEISSERAAYENEGHRDPPIARFTKFAAIILVLTLALGALFALEDYFLEHGGRTYWERSAAKERVREDTYQDLKFRFYLGAAIGAGLGLSYMARCLAKDIDP
jgi:hypothetical protein